MQSKQLKRMHAAAMFLTVLVLQIAVVTVLPIPL
jgi:hypothetical protein